MASNDSSSIFQLTPIKRNTLVVEVEGLTPLIVHRFDEKAKKTMLDAQVKTTAKTKRPPQDPQAEYEASRYRLADGGDGMPAVAFKAAIIGAARLFEGLTMVALKQSVFVMGDGSEQLVRINAEPRMREDVVRVGMGTANLRYRAEYWPWTAHLVIGYVESMISADSVLTLVNAAGLGGVGEWRPSAPKSSTGSYGTFAVRGGQEGILL